MAIQILLFKPDGTQYDITSRFSDEGLPDLSLTVEDDNGRMTTGDQSFTFTNHDGWWETTLGWTTAGLDPEDRFDEATAMGIWYLQIKKGGVVRWDGDVDYTSITFDRKLDHRVVSFDVRGILSRYERYNAAKILRVDNTALSADTWTTDRKAHPRIMTNNSATIATRKLVVGDVLHTTKIKPNGKIVSQDLPIKFTSAEDGTLTAYQVKVGKRIKCDLNANAGVTCTTPYWRDLTPAQLAAKLWDWMGVPASRQHCDYTALSDDTIPYADWAGKSVAEAFDELAKITLAINFGKPDGFYFQGRDKILAGKTVKNIDALIDTRSDGTIWDKFTNLVIAKGKRRTTSQREGSDDITKRHGGLVYATDPMEVSTDYAVSATKLNLIATALYSWFGSRRRPLEVTVRDDGTVYDLWDPVEVTVLGTAVTFYVQEITEPLRTIDGFRGEITLKLVAASGTAPTTGDGEEDDQSIDDADPDPPSIVAFTKDKTNTYWKTMRTFFPAKDSDGNLIRPRVIKEWVKVNSDDGDDLFLLLPTKVLYALVWDWDYDDTQGRLLGFIGKFWGDKAGDIDKPMKEKRFTDAFQHTDGHYYGCVYLSRIHGHYTAMQTVFDDGRISAPSDESDGGTTEPPATSGSKLIRVCSYYHTGIWELDLSNTAAGLTNTVSYPTDAQSGYANDAMGCAGGRGFLLVGFRYSGNFMLCRTTDLTNWTKVTPSGYRLKGQAVAVAGDGLTCWAVFVDTVSSIPYVYRSTDGGVTWTKGAAVPNYVSGSIFKLYPHPANPLVCVIHDYQTGPNTCYTTDGGTNLTAVTAATFTDCGMAADGKLWCVYNSTISYSSDYGNTWNSVTVPDGSNSYCDVVCDPVDPNAVYVGAKLIAGHPNAGTSMGIYRTTKGVSSAAGDWTLAYDAASPTNNVNWDSVIDPINPGIVAFAMYCPSTGTYAGMLVTTDYGATATWYNCTGQDYNSQPPKCLGAFSASTPPKPASGSTAYAFGYNPTDPQPPPSGTGRNRKIASTANVGGDFPKVWNEDTQTLPNLLADLCVCPDDDQTVIRADEGSDSLKISRDGGCSYEVLCALKPKFSHPEMVAGYGAVWVIGWQGTGTRFLLRADDYTQDKPLFNSLGPSGVSVQDFCVDRADKTKLWALGTDGKVYASTDADNATPTWDAGNASGFNAGKALGIHFDGTNLWVYGTRDAAGGQNFVVRHYASATWSTIEPSASITKVGPKQLFTKPGSTSTVIVAANNGANGIWRSTDTGANWTQISTVATYAIRPYYDRAGYWLAGLLGSVQYSADDGATWQATAENPGSSAVKWLAFATKLTAS